MILSAEQHRRLALACLKDAAAPQLTLEEKRELQACASRFEAMSRRAAELAGTATPALARW
jgi:hypothetical protein